jgi:hypothetical protein
MIDENSPLNRISSTYSGRVLLNPTDKTTLSTDSPLSTPSGEGGRGG